MVNNPGLPLRDLKDAQSIRKLSVMEVSVRLSEKTLALDGDPAWVFFFFFLFVLFCNKG